MATFLFKTEPSEFSFDDLVREKRCTWDGVSNAAARLALRSCAVGDEVLIYHTGDEKRIVGVAAVVGAPRRDPSSEDEKSVVVDVKAVGAVKRCVTLAEIKADARFKEFALVKQSRLSVMAVPGPLAAALKKMMGG
ncbi:MAG: EVE domain-containing protein [Phycisphaerales bacterium]